MTRVRRLTQILGITLIAILVWGYGMQDAGYREGKAEPCLDIQITSQPP